MTCAADDAGTVLDPGFGGAWNGECIRLERVALILRRLLLVKAAQAQRTMPRKTRLGIKTRPSPQAEPMAILLMPCHFTGFC